jgi:hypothetical protein
MTSVSKYDTYECPQCKYSNDMIKEYCIVCECVNPIRYDKMTERVEKVLTSGYMEFDRSYAQEYIKMLTTKQYQPLLTTDEIFLLTLYRVAKEDLNKKNTQS